MMWLNRPFAVSAARRTRASRTPCGHNVGCPRGVRDARFASRCGGELSIQPCGDFGSARGRPYRFRVV
eukprot:1842667-Lingulodinium_polyedra.AAC.1